MEVRLSATLSQKNGPSSDTTFICRPNPGSEVTLHIPDGEVAKDMEEGKVDPTNCRYCCNLPTLQYRCEITKDVCPNVRQVAPTLL